MKKKCKCNNVNHDKKCEYGKKFVIMLYEFKKILLMGFNSSKYNLTFFVQHIVN